MRLEDSTRLREVNGYLLVAPVGATMVVRSDLTRRSKVFHCAHALGHIVLNHGNGRDWYILRDFTEEALASPEEVATNREAGDLAEALLNGHDPSAWMKLASFRWALQHGVDKPFIRNLALSLQELHHHAQGKLPTLNSRIRDLPGLQLVWASGRAVFKAAVSERQFGAQQGAADKVAAVPIWMRREASGVLSAQMEGVSDRRGCRVYPPDQGPESELVDESH